MNDVRRPGGKNKSVFKTMCDIWGIDTAAEKCKEFGIHVSTLELKEAQDRDKQKKENIAAIIRQLREKKQEVN